MPRLQEPEALRLLAASPVARLGTIAPDGSPQLVPITFVLHLTGRGPARLYSAVDAKPKSVRWLRRLDNIRADPRVAVLADHYSDDWNALWWVRADGSAQVRTEPDETTVPLRMLAAKYPQYREQPPAGPVIAVTISRLTGWAALPQAGGSTGWRRPG